MSNLHLTLACEDYDRTRPVKDGIVKPEGIELNYLVMSVEEIFWRMMKYEEFDASELSMGAFLTGGLTRPAAVCCHSGVSVADVSSSLYFRQYRFRR